MKWKNRNRFELGMLNQIWKRFLTEQKTQTEQMENQKLFENMFVQSEKIKRKRNYPISKLPKPNSNFNPIRKMAESNPYLGLIPGQAQKQRMTTIKQMQR